MGLLKIYFGPYYEYIEVGFNSSLNLPSRYDLNADQRSLILSYDDGKLSVKYHYTLLGDTGLKLVTTAGSGKPLLLTQFYRRRVMRGHVKQ